MFHFSGPSTVNEARSDSYKEWRELGWCLKNICDCPELLQKWIEFSQLSLKFKNGQCEQEWQKRDSIAATSTDALKIGSLIAWARNDNPSQAAKAEYEYYLDKSGVDDSISFEAFLQCKHQHDGSLHYIVIKKMFEKSNVKILDQACYAYIDKSQKNMTFLMYDRHKFRERYFNLHCYIQETVKGRLKKTKKCFVEQWFKDCDIRTYNHIDFCPPPIVCPHNVLNVWGGFAIDTVMLGLKWKLPKLPITPCYFSPNWL